MKRFRIAWLCASLCLLLMLSSAAAAAGGSGGRPATLRDPVDWSALGRDRDAEQAQRKQLEARRAQPGEHTNRERSRNAYAGLSATDALKVAREAHDEVMGAPLWDPMPVRSGERVQRHLGENAAVVEDAHGQMGIYESSLPMLSKTESGALAPTSLKLMHKGTAIVPSNPIVPTTIGGTLGDGTSFDGTGIGFQVEGAPSATAAVTDDNAFFANTRRDTDVVVAPQPRGVETFFQLRSIDSPQEQRLHFTLPNGVALQPGQGGGVDIVRGDTELATIAPPKAWDAEGVEVQTSYDVSGDDLIVHVEHLGGDFAYPIVVDPQVYWDYRNWNTNSNLADTGWRFLTPYPSQFDSLHLYPTWYGRGDYIKTPRAWTHYNGGEWAGWDLFAPVGAYIFRTDFTNGHYDPSGPICLQEGLLGADGGPVHDSTFGYYDNHDAHWHPTGTDASVCNTTWDQGTWQFYFSNDNGSHVNFDPPGAANGNVASWELAAFAAGDAYESIGFEGGALVGLGDRVKPSATISGVTPGTWVDQTTAQITGQDNGLGISTMSVSTPNSDPQTAQATCTYNGPAASGIDPKTAAPLGTPPCPPTVGPINVSTSTMPEGAQTVSAATTDAVGNSHADPFTVKVDHTPPTLTGFGGDLAPGSTWVNGGAHQLTFNANDSYSGVSQAGVTVTNNIVGRDDFNRITTNGWGAANTGGAWNAYTGSDPAFGVDGSQATVALAQSTNALRQLGTTTARDVDARVQVSFPNVVPPSGETMATLGLRYQGPTIPGTLYQARLVRDATGELLLRVTGPNATPTLGADVDTGMRFSPGAQYWLRAEVTGASPTRIELKAWPVGASEPSAWLLDRSDSTLGPQQPGGLLLGGKQTGSAAALTLGLDNYTVSDLAAPRQYTPSDNACTTTSGCPTTSPVTFNWDASSEPEGDHVFTANARDPFATNQPSDPTHAITSAPWTVKLDRTAPNDLALSGDLYDARGQTFTDDHTYTLNMNATDALSGVAALTVDAESDGGTPVRVYSDSQPGAADGSGMNRTWSVRPADYPPGHYTLTVTATDKARNPTSKSFDVTVPAPPANVAVPAVSGAATDGQILSSTTGSWSGTGPLKYSYQWQYCNAQGAACLDLNGETEPAMTLRSEDVGTTVRVRVSTANGGGSAASYSAASPVVAPVPPVMQYAPEVSGKVIVGEQLSAMDGVWSGTTPISYAYQWLRCPPLFTTVAACAPIPGATSPDYTLVPDDSGMSIRVRVVAANASGTAMAATADSDPSDPVGSFVAESTDPLADPPPPSSSEALADAVRYRTDNGLNADPAYIAALDARPDLQYSRDYYGVSLDRYEERDIELRNDITDGMDVIDTYGTTTAASSYAGYYIDAAHGSQVYVGFTSNPDGNLSALRALFAYPAHLHTFAASYTQQELVATQGSVEDDGESGALAAVGVQWAGDSVDVQANRVGVDVANPSPSVASTLTARYGNSVVMKTAVASHRTGPGRSKSQGPKGGLDIYIHPPDPTSDCTLGFIGEAQSFLSQQRAPAFITAGHCSQSYTYFTTDSEGRQAPLPTMDTKEDWHQGGRSIGGTSASVTRNSSRPCARCTVSGKVQSDAVIVALDVRFTPQPLVFISGHRNATVRDEQLGDGTDTHGYEVCASLGRGSAKLVCGAVMSDKHFEPPEGHSAAVHNARTVTFGCKHGDSGSPVFHYHRRGTSQVVKAVGIVTAETDERHCVYSAINHVRGDTGFRTLTGG